MMRKIVAKTQVFTSPLKKGKSRGTERLQLRVVSVAETKELMTRLSFFYPINPPN
ncbi:hypothetical protein CRENPOLYSF2_370072 [Crenothrix polyspora]|uniref:Uncharacterized protein n=1 Tax=Crenothrix polyspora TaxID=360316 RepID=A0A1R4HCR1_9GAMM|nr:hypothetical protein CRENPOLYSF2_370072 [Crenothrix polyspora]